MRSRALSLLIITLLSLDQPRLARAGMPSIMLTDLARMRVQTISFFLACFLACSWVIQRIWNSLGRDFSRLPPLTFGKALGVVTLWGLLFVLVLTMISGARELMTPGAWRKDGLTYKLVEARPAATNDGHEAERRQALERLRIALWTYAKGHGGRFPDDGARTEIPDEAWRVPDPSGMRYLYMGGLIADAGDDLLAYEPGLFGPERLVLRTDGRIVPMSPEEIRRKLQAGRSP